MAQDRDVSTSMFYEIKYGLGGKGGEKQDFGHKNQPTIDTERQPKETWGPKTQGGNPGWVLKSLSREICPKGEKQT